MYVYVRKVPNHLETSESENWLADSLTEELQQSLCYAAVTTFNGIADRCMIQTVLMLLAMSEAVVFAVHHGEMSH